MNELKRKGLIKEAHRLLDNIERGINKIKAARKRKAAKAA